MNHKQHEIWALCTLTVTLLVLLSLVSYRVSDLTLFNASDAAARAPSNWIGFFGANLAWCLFFLLGLGAYGIPLTGLWLSFSLFRGRPFPSEGMAQLGGIVLFVVSAVSLLSLHWPEVHLMGQEIFTGGQLGIFLSSFLVSRLYSVGAHILLLGAICIGVLLATPFTFNAMWSRLLVGVHAVAGAAGAFANGLRSVLPFRKGGNRKTAKTGTFPRGSQQASSGHPGVEVVAPPVQKVASPTRKALPGTLQTRPSSGGYQLPSLELLDAYETEREEPDGKLLEEKARVLEEKLADFGVEGKVVAIAPGPVITTYEYAPAPGIKISRIVNLSDDLSMALKAISIRVIAPIPGKAAIGIEVPNKNRELVSMRAVIESEAFAGAFSPLILSLGKDTMGRPVVANLAKMPHLLIAGATGTGKSVCINAILSSLLYRNSPDEVRLLLIDPKRIELSSYEGIPHLIHPVVTDPKMATRALRWAVHEMELRYQLLAEKNARNIESYNKILAREKEKGKGGRLPQESAEGGEKLRHQLLPYIVVIIDELADLMMVASREVEESITRLAQMARAAGLHLVLATQRPSVDVLTGIIKANIPTRISFQVSSRIDSRTIIDSSGAESLLGSGDMLFLPPGTAKLQRIHGAFISDSEVQRLTDFWRKQKRAEDPLRDRVDFQDQSRDGDAAEMEMDEKYEEAVEIVLETRQASISLLQRRLRVGYNRAARMIEMMEQQGLVTESDGVKPREVIGNRGT
ncbi:MAG: DNA translocase FtsK [Deltaproteobacteria bacterium]|nr:DNA translocase FtsK [Deltaproteobacteria bacterium]